MQLLIPTFLNFLQSNEDEKMSSLPHLLISLADIGKGASTASGEGEGEGKREGKREGEKEGEREGEREGKGGGAYYHD